MLGKVLIMENQIHIVIERHLLNENIDQYAYKLFNLKRNFNTTVIGYEINGIAELKYNDCEFKIVADNFDDFLNKFADKKELCAVLI